MTRTWLAGVSALALLAAMSAPAMADCVVSDNGDIINVVTPELVSAQSRSN